MSGKIFRTLKENRDTVKRKQRTVLTSMKQQREGGGGGCLPRRLRSLASVTCALTTPRLLPLLHKLAITQPQTELQVPAMH